MSEHLYEIGEIVTLRPQMGVQMKGAYTIKARLPVLGDQRQYRVRCDLEPYERMVSEHQLVPIGHAHQ